jgi:F0F1-type ATP synthase membrane subunit b/b'
MIVANIWEKIVKFVKKYWQLLLGALTSVVLLIKFWWVLKGQKKILKNEIETNKKINETIKDHDEKMKKEIEKAEKDHKDRLAEIKKNEEEEIEKAKKDLEDRIEENNSSTNKELAEKFADTFNVNVIEAKEDDE